MLFLKLTCHLHAAKVVDRNGNIGEGHGGRGSAGRLVRAACGRGRLHEQRGGQARHEVGVGGRLVVDGGGHHHGRGGDHAGEEVRAAGVQGTSFTVRQGKRCNKKYLNGF